MFRVPCQDDRGEINATYLMKNKVWLIAEGANMPSIRDADDIFVDNRPHGTMVNLHGARREATETYNTPGNYVNGANIAAFKKIAGSMLDQGLVYTPIERRFVRLYAASATLVFPRRH